MDQLEKTMRENKELFIDQEPAKGHLQRFEKKLSLQNRRVKTMRLTAGISRIAAIGLLVIMSSLWAYNEFLAPEKSIALSEVNRDYQDVEFYFTNQINSKYQELTNSGLLDDTVYNNVLQTEINQMDSVYTQLQRDLGANPGDERIINAMISHYQVKLQVLSDILDRLLSLQQQNSIQIQNYNQDESIKL